MSISVGLLADESIAVVAVSRIVPFSDLVVVGLYSDGLRILEPGGSEIAEKRGFKPEVLAALRRQDAVDVLVVSPVDGSATSCRGLVAADRPNTPAGALSFKNNGGPAWPR